MSLIESNARLRSDEAVTPLFRASRDGRRNDVKTILARVNDDKDILNVAETSTGWTPLTIACINGHPEVVRSLLEAGAIQGRYDRTGWTEKEYAVFQGHLAVARLLVVHEIRAHHISAQNDSLYTLEVGSGNHIDRRTGRKLQVPSHLVAEKIFPMFQSRDRQHDLLFVTIGPSNTRSNLSFLELLEGATDDNSKLSIRVTAVSSRSSLSHQQRLVDLPTQGNAVNQPLVFTTDNAFKTSLIFEIIPSSTANEKDSHVVGTAVALIENLRQGLAPNHESLSRDFTIPILGNGSMAHIGSVTFSLLTVTAFQSPKSRPETSLGFWGKDGSTKVVGHRGSGANSSKHQSLQIRENTIQSLLSATALGASCVEFDVQLTKDFVPVISHDFLVMETGGDVPLHALTFQQFMHVNQTQFPNKEPENPNAETEASEVNVEIRTKPRSRSTNACNDSHILDLVERMRYTEHGLHRPVEDATSHWPIHQPSTTLEQVLRDLPDSVPFNLEIKYPMLWEVEDRGMEYSAIEINHFVDTILTMVFKLCGDRDITFSSFSPEVCILLACKQTTFPILFISKAGAVPTGDIRAGSLKGAIEFAKTWGMAGIVMLADVFVMCPRLLAYAKDAGLVVGTYGDLNDDPDCALVRSTSIFIRTDLNPVFTDPSRSRT